MVALHKRQWKDGNVGIRLSVIIIHDCMSNRGAMRGFSVINHIYTLQTMMQFEALFWPLS